MTASLEITPRAFIIRRLHSLMGLWIVLFLIEHLFTNSQSALLIGDQGEGFIRAVNFIKNLPYLPVVEIVLLGVPFLYHGILGIKYAFQSKPNAANTKGTTPALPHYKRNQAYVWQRITAWILVVGVIAHVTFMRFLKYPDYVDFGARSAYFVRLSLDNGLYTVANRLHVKLYNLSEIQRKKEERLEIDKEIAIAKRQAEHIDPKEYESVHFSKRTDHLLVHLQTLKEKKQWLDALLKKPISTKEVIAEAPDFGTATLLMVRDSFKSIWVSLLYTIFVLAASFHAFNGLWTFCITWGVILKMRSQSKMVNVCTGIMVVVAFLGLASIWGTYWLNLRT